MSILKIHHFLFPVGLLTLWWFTKGTRKPTLQAWRGSLSRGKKDHGQNSKAPLLSGREYLHDRQPWTSCYNLRKQTCPGWWIIKIFPRAMFRFNSLLGQSKIFSRFSPLSLTSKVWRPGRYHSSHRRLERQNQEIFWCQRGSGVSEKNTWKKTRRRMIPKDGPKWLIPPPLCFL